MSRSPRVEASGHRPYTRRDASGLRRPLEETANSGYRTHDEQQRLRGLVATSTPAFRAGQQSEHECRFAQEARVSSNTNSERAQCVAAASPNGVPSESLHTAHASPGWITAP